jgi:hypothetical protein
VTTPTSAPIIEGDIRNGARLPTAFEDVDRFISDMVIEEARPTDRAIELDLSVTLLACQGTQHGQADGMWCFRIAEESAEIAEVEGVTVTSKHLCQCRVR